MKKFILLIEYWHTVPDEIEFYSEIEAIRQLASVIDDIDLKKFELKKIEEN